MNEKLASQSQRLMAIALELEKAAQHAKVAATHFAQGEVPRACAHTLATQGHVDFVCDELSQVAKAHRLSANTEG